MIASSLLNGPKSIEEIKDYYKALGRRFGIFLEVAPGHKHFDGHDNMDDFLQEQLEEMKQRNWIEQKDEVFSLTEKGTEEAKKMINELERSGKVLERFMLPKNVSKVTLIVHFILGAIKLPAALISGSVGLFNDSIDTLLDGISSLFVYWGISKNKERIASEILLLFMIIVGGFTLYEAIAGLISREIPSPDFLTFGAVIISAVICLFLWFYQKFAGIKHQSVALITQSIDSRNHILIAITIFFALIASMLHIPFLDSIVGIFISGLILKSAIDLFIELLKSRNEEEIDLSKYGFTFYNTLRITQLKRWLLYQIDKGEITTKDQMKAEAYSALDFQEVEGLKALGLDELGDKDEMIEKSLTSLKKEKLIHEVGGKLILTKEGFKELQEMHILGSPLKKKIASFIKRLKK
ncbi:MAG: cation transporter [Kosmotogaceae bacterium]